jgi:beta-glucosidase
MGGAELARGDWEGAAANAGPGPVVFSAAWARVEPERGRYDDAELAGYRRAVIAARRRGQDPVVVVHAGALPDWAIAREGWLDADALAFWGCYVDRLGHTLAEAVGTWLTLWDPLGEAGWYEGEARRVGRVLLDAHAGAYLQLRRGTGAHAARVGVAVALGGATGFLGARVARFATEAWVRAVATGRLGPPFALTGELPNGTAALDLLGLIGAPGGDRHGVDAHGRPVLHLRG